MIDVFYLPVTFNPYIQEVSGIEAVDIDEKKDYDMACMLAKAEGMGEPEK